VGGHFNLTALIYEINIVTKRLTVQVNVTLEQVTKAQSGSRGIAILFL
jgi:hypothetical protein